MTSTSRRPINSSKNEDQVEKTFHEIHSLVQYKNILQSSNTKINLIVFLPNEEKMKKENQSKLYTNIKTGVLKLDEQLKSDEIPFCVCMIECLNPTFNNGPSGLDQIMQIERVRYLPTFRLMMDYEIVYETIGGWDYSLMYGKIRLLSKNLTTNKDRTKWFIDTFGDAKKKALSYLQENVSDIEINMNDLQLPTDWTTTSPDFLGSGSYGIVVKAFYLSTQVAVKTLANKAIGNSAGLRQLSECCKEVHPNLVPLIGIGLTNTNNPRPTIPSSKCPTPNTWCLIQPLYEGGDLTVLMEPNSNFLKNCLKILLDIACGLAHLHSKQKIHCDLKPANILLDSTKTKAFIADFGYIHTISQIIGFKYAECTLYYAAPEICHNMDKFIYKATTEDDEPFIFKDVTTKSDVYSFGIIALQMLTETFDYDDIYLLQRDKLEKWFDELDSESSSDSDSDASSDATHSNRDKVTNTFIGEGFLYPHYEYLDKISCSKLLIEKLKLCLNFKPFERPDMKEMAALLSEELKITHADTLVKPEQPNNDMKVESKQKFNESSRTHRNHNLNNNK